MTTRKQKSQSTNTNRAKHTQEHSTMPQISTKANLSSNLSTEEKTIKNEQISKSRVIELISLVWMRICASKNMIMPTNEVKSILSGLMIDINNM